MRPFLSRFATLLLCACSPALTVSAATAAAPPSRTDVQHLLRRFAFSASPEAVTAVMAQGIPAWLAAQEQPDAIDDTGSQIEFPPTALNADGSYPDWGIFERGMVQHLLLTPRQLQAKMELHWLDHFAVSLAKVGDPAVMYHYDATLRALALGNFTTLMIAIAREPAMLVWLDNNYNVGPIANENFARECMQLYMMGTTQLNMDGSPVLDAAGVPVPNYTQADVQFVAKAITGYGVAWNSADTNPETRFATQFFPTNHYAGHIHFLGASRYIPNSDRAMDTVMTMLSQQPSVAPFMARELLQRFVTETPSPRYIADIAAVWQAQQDAPDQIAQVITAIVRHPEFASAYHSMPKQPAELLLGALHQLPGAVQAAANAVPAGSLIWELSNLGQELFYPPSVFSFYYPGHLSSLTDTSTVVNRTWILGNIADSDPTNPYADTYIDLPTLRARIGHTDRAHVAHYLADALLDGGSPKVDEVLNIYLGQTPSDARIRGAIWLLLNAPDYAVN